MKDVFNPDIESKEIVLAESLYAQVFSLWIDVLTQGKQLSDQMFLQTYENSWWETSKHHFCMLQLQHPQ